MTYYSIINELNISPGQLILINEDSIYKILNSIKNKNEDFKQIVKDLKNPDYKEAIIYIEQTHWLKKILLRQYESIESLDFEANYITDYSKLKKVKSYCENFIETNVIDCYTNLLNTNRLNIIFKLIENKNHFDSTIIEHLKLNISEELNNVIKGLTNNNFSFLSYLTFEDYYQSANLLELKIEDKLIKISTLCNNQYQQLDNNQKKYVESFFKAVKSYQSSYNFELKKTKPINNIRVAIPQKSSHENNDLKIALGLLFTFIIGVTIFFTMFSSSKNNKKEAVLVESKKEIKSKKLTNHIRFLYSLRIKNNSLSHDFQDFSYDYIVPNSNPYPKTFNALKNYKQDSLHLKTLVLNNSKKDLIIFKLVDGIDECIYISKDESTYIDLNKNDTIVAYSGKDFKVDKFSHFKRNTNISPLYKITDLSLTKPKSIEVNGSNNLIKFKAFTVEHLPSINNLYTVYYNKKYRRN